MYRRSKFLEILHEIRQGMALEADYEINSFAELARHGKADLLLIDNKTEDEYFFESIAFEKVSKVKDRKPKSKK